MIEFPGPIEHEGLYGEEFELDLQHGEAVLVIVEGFHYSGEGPSRNHFSLSKEQAREVGLWLLAYADAPPGVEG